MVTSATISCVSGKQQIRLFTVLWLITWYEQVNISGWGTQGRCRYSAVSLITRYDFMAPVTRVITALQSTRLSMFVIFEELSCTALCNSELSRETVSLYTLFHGFCLDVWIYFQGKQLRHFHFCLPSQKRSTLEGKNLLQKEQILSFKSRPQYGRDVILENKQKVMEVVSLCKKG